ncbi:type II toxin-antitoxin system PemK/MazF family toxin [Solitalea sp. MAHUQ-68]|uniref:Type II toxin-antitoxin system PemK/MazF family toxin n=1 Tax=Solitalea agri TaxID=2953739 RepID=A0A9X2F4Y6_9SPHI|nr:type II toxin-antitoxin system PemK/MazF family toxin [Solitalea agri]MCO4294300.1 type II toxin-antitoxin system PemK/MazF family toxin [Solitalea agri]
MGKFIRGEVVVLPFPFSDLSNSKRCPALVLADLPGDDIILCQITSQHSDDSFSLTLTQTDFISGSLPFDSYIRPNRIFTADKNIIIRKAGMISNVKMQNVISIIHDIIK